VWQGDYLNWKEKGTHLNEYKVGLVTPDQIITLLNCEQPFPPSDDEAEDEHEQRKRATKAEPTAEEPYQNPQWGARPCQHKEGEKPVV
jgi:hypothetical protein